jgi:hypothetical protein
MIAPVVLNVKRITGSVSACPAARPTLIGFLKAKM